MTRNRAAMQIGGRDFIGEKIFDEVVSVVHGASPAGSASIGSAPLIGH